MRALMECMRKSGSSQALPKACSSRPLQSARPTLLDVHVLSWFPLPCGLPRAAVCSEHTVAWCGWVKGEEGEACFSTAYVVPAGSPCTSSSLPVSFPFPRGSVGRARLSSRCFSQAERTPGVLEERPSQLVGCPSPVFQSLHHAWWSWSGWLCPVVRLVFSSGERAADATLGRQSWAISPNQLWPQKHEL